jgi:hypothetical protein
MNKLFFNCNYDWGFRQAETRLNYGIALFVDDELFDQIKDNLGLIINELEL